MHRNYLGDLSRLLISFLLEFITAPIVIPVVIAIIVVIVVPLLELLLPVIAVLAILPAKSITPVVPVPISRTRILLLEALHERRIGKRQLPVSKIRQLALNSVVMNGLFMPVVIRQLHVIRHRIRTPGTLVRIFLGQ